MGRNGSSVSISGTGNNVVLDETEDKVTINGREYDTRNPLTVRDTNGNTVTVKHRK